MYYPFIIERRGVTSRNHACKILSNDDDNGNENGQFVLSWQRDVTTCNVLLARACASNIFCRQKCLRPLLSGTVALVKSDAMSKNTSKCFHLLQNQASLVPRALFHKAWEKRPGDEVGIIKFGSGHGNFHISYYK